MTVKKQYYLYLFFCFIPFLSMGQNLIQNGGFEDISQIPTAVSQLHLANHWESVSITADLFCTPDFFNILAHSGNCYAGLGLWVSNAPIYTTESFKQKLKTPLIAGRQYFIKFYVAGANWSLASCGQIEVHGTMSDPNTISGHSNYISHFVPTDLMATTPTIQIDNKWRLVELCFIPEQNSEYLIFSVSNSDCDHYFYMDDIELYELETEKFFEDEASLCKDETIVLGTEISNTTFQWQDGSTSPIYTVTEPGLYWWSVDTVCGLMLSDSILIKDGRIDLEDDFLGSDSSLCREEIMILEVPSDDEQLSFEWNNGQTKSSIEVTETGTYEVLVQKEACSITDTVEITYITCEDCVVNAPNIFSPNLDGFNDDFRAFSNCPILNYSIKIFDRWGAMVFSSDSIENTWDGQTPKKESLNAGLFVYIIEYEAEQYGEMVSGKVVGEVTIIK